MIELSDEQVIELMDRIVAEKGEDFVYERPDGYGNGCKYVHYDEDENPIPGCVVGHFFVRAGVSIGELHSFEGESAIHAAERLEVDGILKMSIDSHNFLYTAQDQQDSGETWGDSLAAAKRYISF